MLSQIPDIATGVVSLFVSGRLSANDYRDTLLPQIEQYRETYGRVCLYIEADVLLEGWDIASLTGTEQVTFPEFDALAFVGGPDWVGNAVNLLSPFMQGEIAWFALENKQDAIAWIAKKD
ncbi:STAS/SEC14 domain-containing protein [Shewanella maritima]|uniref:STAS/SEC14 domain-containing protein n=1 Tax=Shewanella maritima TaxID=2520507 RepID=UPI003735DCBF